MSSGDWHTKSQLLKKWLAVLAAATEGRDPNVDERLSSGGLSMGDLCVLMWILDYSAPPDWTAWPSISTLVRVTGMSRSTVLRATSRLEAVGYIQITKGSHNTSNTYRPTFKGAEQVMNRKAVAGRGSGAGSAAVSPLDGGVDGDTSGGVTDGTSGGVAPDTTVVSATINRGVSGGTKPVSPTTGAKPTGPSRRACLRSLWPAT